MANSREAAEAASRFFFGVPVDIIRQIWYGIVDFIFLRAEREAVA